MSAIDVLAGAATMLLLLVFVGCSVLSSSGLSLERRASMLERRDPAAADALRRAESLHEFSYGALLDGALFMAMCTPSRRSALDMALVRGSDADVRVEAADEPYASPRPQPEAQVSSEPATRAQPEPEPVALENAARLDREAHVVLRRRAARRARATSRRRAGIR